MRPPVSGEVVHPELMTRGLTFSLNKGSRRPADKTMWTIHFPEATYTLLYDGADWSRRLQAEADADVSITTTPEVWATVMTAPRTERRRLAEKLKIEGKPEKVEEFRKMFGLL
jgi:hypothetical protein